MYELKKMRFKIILEKPRWRPSYKWCPYNISTLTAVLDGMLDALFYYSKPLNKVILEIVCINSNYILPVPNESR